MNLLVNYAGKNHKFHNTKMRVGNAETVNKFCECEANSELHLHHLLIVLILIR